jgi:hypothetical protein
MTFASPCRLSRNQLKTFYSPCPFASTYRMWYISKHTLSYGLADFVLCTTQNHALCMQTLQVLIFGSFRHQSDIKAHHYQNCKSKQYGFRRCHRIKMVDIWYLIRSNLNFIFKCVSLWFQKSPNCIDFPREADREKINLCSRLYLNVFSTYIIKIIFLFLTNIF